MRSQSKSRNARRHLAPPLTAPYTPSAVHESRIANHGLAVLLSLITNHVTSFTALPRGNSQRAILTHTFLINVAAIRNVRNFQKTNNGGQSALINDFWRAHFSRVSKCIHSASAVPPCGFYVRKQASDEIRRWT